MHIIIISRQEEETRRAFQTGQMARLGLSFEFLDAFEARDLTDAECQAAANMWPSPSLPQDIACFRSHRLAWTRVVKTGQPTLILEDDAVLAETLPQVLTAIEAAQIPANAAFDLEFTPEPHILDDREKLAFLGGKVVARRVFKNRVGLAAYVIGPQVAGRMLKDTERYGLIDSYFWHRPWLMGLQIEPAQAVQMRFLQDNEDAQPYHRPQEKRLFRPSSKLRKALLRLELELNRGRCLLQAAFHSQRRQPLIDRAQFRT
ncbi:glycosyltransferase family 25 protein [Aquamicrobium zhengzhouense]|uniref:Glycosyltransferase family 25 protein n=1 Tax=Aquamicrobium zhengzhouense TaxID=2781738 RepID=A0ABS0SFL2_9HYPH|nr:glycosyltransferase family 25 protein [Aquamicrobium zhengzhouense]MBI1622072.1 glycosyltransferase family 25 protein [Aquamicrobium zhengzhouense]